MCCQHHLTQLPVRQAQHSVMTHAHRASSQEIKVRHMLKGKRARLRCIWQVTTPLRVSPLFSLCTGWQTASQSSLQSSIHREVDSPSPQGESQTISTLPLAFICFFLDPGNSDSCNTVTDHCALGLSPRAGKGTSPLLLER